jgi:transcriptional regulator with XRE-family HTH domain
MTTFGKRLQELRKEQGISQRDLAERVNLDFTYLSKMENERLEFLPSAAAIRRIAQALSADAEELLSLAGKDTLQAQDVRSVIMQQMARREKRIAELRQELKQDITTPGRLVEVAILIDRLDHAICVLIELEHALHLCGCPDAAYTEQGGTP